MVKKAETTHVIYPNELVLYKRDRSTVWQCRYGIDGQWQRVTTKKRDLGEATKRAKDLLLTAQIRKRDNLPVITRRFSDIAKLAVKRMQDDTALGNGKHSYNEYIHVINTYLIPIFNKRKITSIDNAALQELDSKRVELMQKAPTRSTILSHNAALNKVFDEAVIRGFLTESNRPTLKAAGKASERRADFSLNEINLLLSKIEDWANSGRTEKSRELRQLLRDYIEILLDTGARPGVELLTLKWNQIHYHIDPETKQTGENYTDAELGEMGIDAVSDDGHDHAQKRHHDLNAHLEMSVSGKTGRRTIIGNKLAIRALLRIAKRNFSGKGTALYPLSHVLSSNNSEYVIRTQDKAEPTSFAKLFDTLLKHVGLQTCPKTGQKRVLYSLRHTYATFALTHDKVPVHTLAVQMGTSVGMIEKHYSHLQVLEARKQLQGLETSKLIGSQVPIAQ